MRFPLAALVTLLPAVAHAQLEAAPPSALAPVVAPVPSRPPNQLFFSLRLSIGAALALASNGASAVSYGAAAGLRWVIPVGSERAWVLGADAGVDRTGGFGDRDATLLSVGVMPGFSWGTLGLAWAPRAVVAFVDGGGTAWGVRNGLRLLIVVGAIDVELAHQYLGGPDAVSHQGLVTVAVDPGLVIDALSRHRGRW